MGVLLLWASSAFALADGRFGFTIDNVQMRTSGLEPGQKMQRVVVQYTAQKAQLVVNQGTGHLVGWIDADIHDVPSTGRLGDIQKTTSAGLCSTINASGLKPTQQAGLLFTAPTKLGKHTLTLAIYEPAHGNQYEVTHKENIAFTVGKGDGETIASLLKRANAGIIENSQNGSSSKSTPKSSNSTSGTPRNNGEGTSHTAPRAFDMVFLTGGVDIGALNMSKAERRLRGYDRQPIPSGLIGTWVSDESSLVFIYRADGRFANIYLTGSGRVKGREFGLFVIHEITAAGAGGMTLDITQRNQSGGGHTHQKHVLRGNEILYAGKLWKRQE